MNDIDRTDPATVARKLAQTVQKMRDSHPQLKIVVSEITPRMKTKDDEVQICNEHLHAYLDPMDNVTMALHTNLRTTNWEYYKDDKHFDPSSIRKFASNLKIALRSAMGIAERERKTKTTGRKQKIDSVGEFKKRLLQVLQGM